MALDVNDLMNELSSGSKWDTGVTFNRTNPVPIDKSSYFTHISAAENYALSGKTSYVGQQLFVLNADLSSADAYIIQDASGNLKKLDVSQHTLQKTIVTYDDGSVKSFDWSGELTTENINNAKGYGSIVDVKIGNAVTSIGEDVFHDCSGLTNVTIPDSVTSIGDRVFAHCHNLTSVTIGDSVTNIGEQAFYNCGLTGITIPDSVMSIGEGAFQSCSNLMSVTIPNSVTSIGWAVFFGCTSLMSVTIPNSVTSIGNNAFSGCSELTSVTIPDSVTSVGNWAFSGCSGLTNVTIRDGVTNIGGQAFSSCTNLSTKGCVVFKGKQLSDIMVMDNHYWGLQLSNITTWNDASQEWVNNKVYDLTSNGISANTISAYNLSSNNISAQSISVNSFDLSIGSIVSSYTGQSTISVLSVQDKLTVEGNLVVENDCYFGDSTTIHIGESNTLCTLLSDQFTPLSNAISSKVYTGTIANGEQSGNYSNLSVVKITKEEYEQKITDAAYSGVDLSNNVLYIISSDYIDAYEQRIENVVMSNDNIPSEATNKHYVDSISSNLVQDINQLSTKLSNDYALTSTLSGISAELSNSISSKIHYENLIDGTSANIDLSITKLSPEQYEDKVVNNKIDDHTLYVVSANHLDAFGKTIKNITMTNDSIPSEATNRHYVDSISSNLMSSINQLSTVLSNDYALTTDIPTYSDISTNIHLSDYALTNNVSTTIELQQQFNGDKAYIDSVKSYADGISSKVDNLSNDLIYATVFTDTSLEGLTASTGDAGTRKLVFKPSYFGMNSSDELKSIVLQTRSNSSGYGITSAYIRVRKYNGLGDSGEIIGTSKCFNWPTHKNENIQIDFDQVIQFDSPIEQYYFECLSADASSNLGVVNVFGMAMRVLNSADPNLPQISGNYFVTGIYNGNETIFPQLRPPLSVNYRHAYSMADLSAQVDEKYNQLIGQTTDLSSADTIYGAKAYASDLVNSLDATDTPTTGKFVVAVSQENGVISVQKAELTIPEGLSSYADTVANLSNDGYALTSTTTQVANELSNAISSKAYVGNLQSGKYTDLSILKVTAHEYESIVVNAAAGGVDLSNNVVYIVSSDYIDAYGQRIENVVMSNDNTPSEATNKHYVDGSSRNALSTICNGILSALSAADIIGKQQSEITFANVLSGMYFLVNYISSIQNSVNQ